MSNFGKVLPDGLVEAIYDTGASSGVEKAVLFEMHLANMRGDGNALLKSIAEVASVVVDGEDGTGFSSSDSTMITGVNKDEILTGLAHKARRTVDAWLKEKAPESVVKAYEFDQTVRAYMHEQPDFTFEIPKESAEQLIALGLEIVKD